MNRPRFEKQCKCGMLIAVEETACGICWPRPPATDAQKQEADRLYRIATAREVRP